LIFPFIIDVILGQGEEQTAMAAIWLTDGIDLYRVGFPAQCYVGQEANFFDSQLVQVTDLCLLWKSENQSEQHCSHQSFGCTKASIISTTTMGAGN
jgi:hypothetical protein